MLLWFQCPNFQSHLVTVHDTIQHVYILIATATYDIVYLV